MQTTTQQPSIPLPVPPIPTNYFQAVEGSILAAVALFLIRGLWAEHCHEEKHERELINRLIDRNSNIF